jgi:hypothetical protein
MLCHTKEKDEREEREERNRTPSMNLSFFSNSHEFYTQALSSFLDQGES